MPSTRCACMFRKNSVVWCREMSVLWKCNCRVKLWEKCYLQNDVPIERKCELMASASWCWVFTGEAWVYLWLCLDSHNLGDSRGIAWLEGQDIARQAQSLDGICVHKILEKPRSTTPCTPPSYCWGLNTVSKAGGEERRHQWHQWRMGMA